jgi:hypothetical protein
LELVAGRRVIVVATHLAAGGHPQKSFSFSFPASVIPW